MRAELMAFSAADFRRRVLEEAARHDVDLIFSVVWALDCHADLVEMESYASIFDEVAFVEDGRVVATGTHADLLARVPAYRAVVVRESEVPA